MKNVSKEELNKMKADDLRKGIAKELNISGRWDLKKDDLINAILLAEQEKESGWEQPTVISEQPAWLEEEETTEVKKPYEITSVTVEGVTYESDNTAPKLKQPAFKPETEEEKKSLKLDVEAALPGVIVVFRLPDGKVKSAMVKNKSSVKRMFKLETAYGKEFLVSYDDILCVKHGHKFPDRIFRMLKGYDLEPSVSHDSKKRV